MEKTDLPELKHNKKTLLIIVGIAIIFLFGIILGIMLNINSDSLLHSKLSNLSNPSNSSNHLPNKQYTGGIRLQPVMPLQYILKPTKTMPFLPTSQPL